MGWTFIGNTIVNRRGGGQSWSSYWTLPTGLPAKDTAKDDIVFCLMAIEGTNFVDGVNGWEFPINDMDFAVDEATWTGDTTIFPFKTASTISPPADATTKALIIPYDVNNFWYAADGTPNSIPVQAFFNNIDFANKCFCTHVDHTVNADLEELTPSGVKYITLYKSARTVDSTYTDFFGADCALPTSNVAFVSKSGDDATGDGSFANPWLTIFKGLSTITSTHALWVLSGVYNEVSPGYDYLRTGRSGTTVNLKCAGSVEIQSDNATYVIYTSSTTFILNIDGLIFQGKNIYLSQYASGSWNRIKFKTGATIGNVATRTLNKSVINGTFNINGVYTFNENFGLNGAISTPNNSTTTFTEVTYCKFKTTSGNNNDAYDYGNTLYTGTIKYCYFNLSGAGVSIDIGIIRARTFTHLFTFERNIVQGVAGVKIYPSDVSATSTFKAVIRYNKFECLSYGLSFSSALFESSDILYNYFKCLTEDSPTATCVSINPSNITVPFKINYNRFYQENKNGTILSFGEGSTGGMDGTEIIGNYLRGHLYNRPTITDGTCHGLLANGGINFVVKYNRFEYLPLGCVIKTNDGGNYTAGGVLYNTFFNNQAHFYYRKVEDLQTLGNTYKNTTIACLRIGAVDEQSYACESPVFKNNIFTYNGNSFLFALADSILEGGAGDVSFDDNIFEDAGETVIYYFTATTELTYAQAVTAGFIVNGEQATPVFTDANNGDLSLQAGSPGRGDGTALDAAYDDGLDVTTDWNDDADDDDPDNYPTIVTKQQGASWDKGAYVH